MSNLKIERMLMYFESKSLYVHSYWIEEILNQINVSFFNDEELEQQIMKCLLNSDIKKILTLKSCLPKNVFDLHNCVLLGPYCLQVIQIQDIGFSLLEQLEYLEKFEDNGRLKAFNIIKEEPITDDDNNNIENDKNKTVKKMFKLLLEDASGCCIWAIEHKPIQEIHLKMNIGSKILLKNILILRGVLMLNPMNITFLGGKIDELNKNYFPCIFRNQLKQKLYNITI
ncbi:hypothetical protein PCANB_002670 [Pneumocystis canis]|nr:hypothetical protein PCK1_002692 [Pneumocystis canis]KAG5438566.1 hypothetical protein PCANB_002670 [Pneumocystis canis]